MPGLLLLSTLVACFVGGAPDESTGLDHIDAEFSASRGAETGVTVRPPLDLDASVLLYSGMPISVRGETKLVGGLGLSPSRYSLAVCEKGLLTAMVLVTGEAREGHTGETNVAVVREQSDGTFTVLALDTDPVVGFPNARIDRLGSGFQNSTFRYAVLPDGSYRTVADLDFEPDPDVLSGTWLIDIDEYGIHPVVRFERHVASDGRRYFIGGAPYSAQDLSLPIGGVTTPSGTTERYAWRISGRDFELFADLSELPIPDGALISGSESTTMALHDGSVLALGFIDGSGIAKAFYIRLCEDDANIEFLLNDGTPPGLPGGNEIIGPSFNPSFLTPNGYVRGLSARVLGVSLKPLYAANFGAGVLRFIDNETFSDFPPAGEDSIERVVAVSNFGDMLVLRRTTDASDKFASLGLYLLDEDGVRTPVAGFRGAAQFGVLRGGFPLDWGGLPRDITRDGTVVFGLQYENSFGIQIAFSQDLGYRVLSTSGDRLAVPGSPAREVLVFQRHIGQDPGGTLLFTGAFRNLSVPSQYDYVIFRQSIDSSVPLADLNRDGEVNLLDLNLVLKGLSSGSPFDATGDVDLDSQTTPNDLQMLLDQWGKR